MIKFRLYIPPVILGFVIVPLLVWPTVIVLAVLIFTLTFLAEIIFSFPLLVVRISLQELQLELMVEYALIGPTKSVQGCGQKGEKFRGGQTNVRKKFRIFSSNADFSGEI